MASFHAMNNYMVSSPNQKAVNNILAYMERMAITNVNASFLDRLANLPSGPPFKESMLDRALGFLRAEYDDQREFEWAVALKPWDCRLLNRTIGASFTRVFCTKLCIPFDGCYDDLRDVGRLDNFLTTFGNIAAQAAGQRPIKGAMNPWYIKELVFYQDPLSTSTDPGSLRDQSKVKSNWHFHKRLDEDFKGGLLPTVTPKRMKAYAKICDEAHEEQLRVLFSYDPNKVCLMWLRIIDLLKFLPNLEAFHWHSDARVIEPFLSAISHFCKKLKVLEIDLHNSFDTNEYMLNAWNRFYLSETTGRLYQSHQILNKPVAKHICEYISRHPDNRPPQEFPAQCHIILNLMLRMDREVASVFDTIGKYTRHVQSLLLDRSKSHAFLDDNKKTEHVMHFELIWSHRPFGVTELCLVGTDATMHDLLMRAIIPESIESLDITDGQSLGYVYFPIIAGQNRLRKFEIAFPPPGKAKERAYSYWQHYMLQKRLTFDFLRCDTIQLDELEIRGDFGEPTLNPVEFSGLSTDLFFAIEAQAKSLVRLYVINENIDFSLPEIATIITKAENLTQLGITCRAFRYQDAFGNWVEQGLGTRGNFERLLGLLGGGGNPFALTILRTHYNALDEVVYDRDGAGRTITPTRSALDLEIITKKMVERGLPLSHLAIFSETRLENAYAIFTAEWDEYLYAFDLKDGVLRGGAQEVRAMYAEFEDDNREWIETSDIEKPKPLPQIARDVNTRASTPGSSPSIGHVIYSLRDDGSAFSAAYKPGQSPPSSSSLSERAIHSSLRRYQSTQLPSIPTAASDESSSARGILRSQKESRHGVRTVATLTLFGIASPDAYRTQLWKLGGELGFNSSPDQILYAYANYRPIPKTPLVWSDFITNYNIVVSVLSMFILLVKVVLFIMHMFIPLVSVIINAIVLALWCFSAYGQAGPDHSDPEHPSSVAWYIAKSCSVAEASGNKHNCEMAKGSFASTIFMIAIFALTIALGIWSMIPTEEAKEARKAKKAAEKDSPYPDAGEKLWELRNIQTPAPAFQPYTPRTLAFNTLDRQLPLREKTEYA
ncbi:hypothetical protein V494_02331 [Pseudogymnoascus sp. VKM F-4513 (FW-928)]|nr:hypothetical protein V494_02331 [Pseudogymnoascus sp. VKM F-4513 (FW-928)]